MKDLQANQTIGNYRVIRRIGRGGMGSVYEVESLDLHERFALKTFTYDPKDDDGDVLKNKFLEEGKILARLRHPNIAHVYSLAYDKPLEQLYFVMDLVLSEDGRPYSVENASFADLEEGTAYAWFVDVCEALDYIHSQGIVHRDIKPANLLVKQNGHIVLTDFGIAKITSGKLKEEVNPALTMRIDGNVTVLGSNHYMAPEVEMGGEVTPAADAYSLGVMMFEMLTGKYFDKVEDPWSLLNGRKYPWKHVLSMFLAEDPANRPLGYAELAKRMPEWKGEDVPVVFEERQEEPSVPEARPDAPVESTKKSSPIPLIVVGALIIAGAVAAGIYCLKPAEQAEVKSIPAFTPPPVSEPVEEEVKFQEVAMEVEPETALEKEEKQAAKLAEEKKNAKPEAKPVEKPKAKEEKKAEAPKKVEAKPTPPPAAKPAPKPQEPPKKVEAKPTPPPAAKPAPKKIDYGPIPKRTYEWFKDAKQSAPKSVEFELANGEKFYLQPYAPKKDYWMIDGWDMGTHAHVVEFTRPYWISKFCVEPRLLREFDAKGFEDCREIEKTVAGKYRVYRTYPYRKILKFCEFLTDKYRSQLPPGYVFRLPTDAEWDRAIDRQGYKEAARLAKIPNWLEVTQYSSAKMRSEFQTIRQSLNLDKFGKWEAGPSTSGFLIGKGILIGGRSMPSPNDVYDVAYGTQPLLDFLPKDSSLVYAESEIDPLQGVDDLEVTDTGKARILGRYLEKYRSIVDAGCSFIFHLALGPDLMAEKAWQKRIVSENPVAVPLPVGHYAWNPKSIPSKLSRPKEIDFKLANGAKMTFCAIPKGKFVMSNVSGQDAKSHKVELDYAFWMSKYCVTSEQRRDYSKYDCEGACRKLEKAFPDDPVYCAFNLREWDAYCKFLTERYRSQIPEGYVFRLPTEAEYEWAFVSDEKTEVKSVNTARNPGDKKVMEKFAKRIKKEGRSLLKDMDGRGFLGPESLCLGGIAEPNVFGVYDLWLDGWSQWTYDRYDWDPFGQSNGCPERNVFYGEKEKDPMHWDGCVAKGAILRSGRSGRTLAGFDWDARAHIVLAPDFAAPLNEAELQPCPETDFGGKFIEGATVHSLSSQQNPARWCTPENMAKLLTRDPAKPGEANQAFLTQDENAPWVQIELAQRMTLNGAVIETLANRGRAAHLMFWISEDGKRWREIAKCDRTLGRYRLDFKGKNASRVKYVRIGREPGRSTDSFSLHKVWLYGKK